MNRIAGIVLAMASSRGGIVLIDEIENGIHHTVLQDLWRAIERSAKYFDVQVFATTHSFECLSAAGRSLSEKDMVFHRLEVTNGSNQCTTYEAEEFEAALEHDFEVR